MKKIKIKESRGATLYIKGRGIPKGCQYCLKGTKAVLFLNGICQKPNHCSWYCPISKERKDKDITFANEIQITKKEELLEEINKINAKGMSITGGDPLLKTNLEKTIEFIKYAKSVKSNRFHIHLYTNGINFNEELANKLAKAGLDEIRFHPPKEQWNSIEKALNKGIIVGAEVPVIPKKENIKNLEEFIIYLDKIGAEFINLNEFEYCVSNCQSLKEKGFILKKGTIASVQNSREIAVELIEKLASKTSIKIHFCSIRAKDYYQLKNRYLRRAKTIKLPYEEITKEGLFLFAQIEGNKLDLKKFYKIIKTKLKISESYVILNAENIKLPCKIVLKEKFISLLEEHNLNGYIVEAIPFRGAYYQITEQTPIKIYRQEISANEN